MKNKEITTKAEYDRLTDKMIHLIQHSTDDKEWKEISAMLLAWEEKNGGSQNPAL
jgi:hypothetical protein